jgi:cytochrome c-type biogenesis protein CcmH/NrfG
MVAPKSPTPQAGTTGEPVDTSKYDAEIKRLEEKAKKNPADQGTRLALAKAYTDRGDALTGVRQYRAALGDYRRALRNDPNNEQAQQMAGTIISILKSMGRDVPPEGQEPPPLKQ